MSGVGARSRKNRRLARSVGNISSEHPNVSGTLLCTSQSVFRTAPSVPKCRAHSRKSRRRFLVPEGYPAQPRMGRHRFPEQNLRELHGRGNKKQNSHITKYSDLIAASEHSLHGLHGRRKQESHTSQNMFLSHFVQARRRLRKQPSAARRKEAREARGRATRLTTVTSNQALHFGGAHAARALRSAPLPPRASAAPRRSSRSWA